MANLLKETKKILEQHGKTFDDIIFVGDTRFKTKMTVEDFIKRANNNFMDDYDSIKINMDLILVGKDFWLERKRRWNSFWIEWWEYKSMPNVNDFVDGVVYIFDEAKMNAMYYSRND